MAEAPARSAKPRSDPPRARRLKADARRRSILEAARTAFSRTGDVNGTTMKVIAEYGGISEGVIYRHFESKDQLFYEAVVDPLREAVDELVAASEVVDRDEPLTPERQLQTLNGLYRQLTSTLEDVLPLLGLVLFGDPKVAKRFYDEHFVVAMDRLAEAWRKVEDRYDLGLRGAGHLGPSRDGDRLDAGPGEPLQQGLRPHPRHLLGQRGHDEGLLPSHGNGR